MSAALPADPRLSIVLTVVEGGAAVARALDALLAQEAPPPLEIVVPYDDTAAYLDDLAPRYPAVRFLAMGTVPTEQPPTSAAGEHELFDRRRAAGLAVTTGDLVAILEDRGTPRADWARTAVRLHAALPNGVIGGAIDPLPSRLLEFAIHVCDFTRYTSPFVSGPREWVSDVNVVYKRRVLEQTRELWRERYQEPVVHWSLQKAGEALYLSDQLVVLHRRAAVPLSALADERFHWGRLFGAIRGRSMSAAQRLVFALTSPLIPLVLLLRHGRAQAAKGRLGRVVAAVPALLFLLVTWTAGEVAGVVTRRT